MSSMSFNNNSNQQPVGIVAYGTALPSHQVKAAEIAMAQGAVLADGQPDLSTAQSLGVLSKTVPDHDEDAATLATAAGLQALQRWQLAGGQPEHIEALWVGSESHPYAVKPTGTMVAEALGISSDQKASPRLALADLQFACKAATQGLQISASYVASGLAAASVAIGADTAQAKPGDVLEYAAAAGAAAYIVGSGDGVVAEILDTLSIATDLPDFWRRPGQAYPQHAGRFTGEPAYFAQVTTAASLLLSRQSMEPSDIDWCVFHTPNAKFPQAAAAQLGFAPAQLAPSLVVKDIGNTYAAASLLALAATLDQAQPDQTILLVSYGSGAGSDAFLLRTTQQLINQRQAWNDLLQQKISRLTSLNLHQYQIARNRHH